MANSKKEAPVAETNLVDQIMMNHTEEATRTLTYEQALKLVDENFAKVTSKNGMLKLLRAEGYSIAMNRLFKIYGDYEKAFKAQAKPAETAK